MLPGNYFLLGVVLALSGIAIYFVAARLPGSSGSPLFIVGTILAAIGAAILLAFLAMWIGIRALGFGN